MKIKIIDGSNIIVFLNKIIYGDINFESKQEIQEKLKTLFHKICSSYGIKIYGYYNVTIYIDKLYGVVLVMEKEDLDYMEYHDDQIDMRIVIIETEFLYEVIDPLFFAGKGLIKYKDKFYIKIGNKIDNYSMGKLLENTILVYDKTRDIIKYGKCLTF